MDTIYALSTARGRAGLAVIRVSGPQAMNAANALCGSVPAPRTAKLRKLKDTTGAVLVRDGTTDHAALADFQAATGQGANSQSGDPGFLADNLTPTSQLFDDEGTPIASIAEDLNGTPRDPSTTRK